MNKVFASAAVAALLVAAPAWAQSNSPTTRDTTGTSRTVSPGMPSDTKAPAAHNVSRADRDFVKTAAKDGMAEVELGKVGQQKAQNPAVKKLGDQIVQDHQAANTQLMSIASSKGIELGKENDKDIQKTRNKLAKLGGAEFDRQFADQLVKDHKKDISLFEKEAKNGQDPDIKNFAAQTLPKLQEHLRLAQAAADETKRTQTSRAPAAPRTERGTSGSTMAPSSGMSGAGSGAPCQ